MQKTKNSEFTPPAGWVTGASKNSFGSHVGPLYFRDDKIAPGVGFVSQDYHQNLGNFVHGGMMMTLADMALFTIYFFDHPIQKMVTVSMNSEFLRPAPIGAFITATGEVVKSGRRLSFIRGIVSADNVDLMHFSGSLAALDDEQNG